MKKIFTIVAAVTGIAFHAAAQNVFPEKIEGCNTEEFCLDCGDPKAAYDQQDFDRIITDLRAKYDLKGVSGMIGIQVLVDSLGNPCVLSHTDKGKHKIVMDAIDRLRRCKWKPAIQGGKGVSSSVNVFLTIADGQLTGAIKHIDMDAVNDNIRNPGTPVIYNKQYTYSNGSLDNYDITIWQKENSGLPQDMSQHNIIDKNDTVWYITFNGMVKFDGKNFVRLTLSNSPFKAKDNAYTIAVDQQDNKWLCIDQATYKYNNRDWVKCTASEIGVGAEGGYCIVPTPEGELLFGTDKGLVILKNGKYTVLDTSNVTGLPSNRVDFAYRDRKHRLWIGTFSGSVMIDTDGKVTNFNQSGTPLKNICLTGVEEDEAGNLYFSLFAFERSKLRDRPAEGLAILTTDGTWKHFNDTNSGMPSNHINGMLYDKFEKVLWIGTNESGLVRYDLKDGWENYHNENSKVPSSYIYDISQNSKGDIYVSTYNGMMRITRKKYHS